MKNLTILICLYKKNINSSLTLSSLIKNSKQIKESEIFIWDNSPIKLSDGDLVKLNKIFKNLTYKSTPENIKLSKIYNTVIKKQKNINGYLALFDDDSNIPSEFFKVLKDEIIKNNDVSLFLPKIYSEGVLVSPAKDYALKSVLFKKHIGGKTSSKRITAINSGMVISNKVFLNDFLYDERLSFYGTDNYFMIYFRNNYDSLFIMDVKISHDLSFNSSGNVENKIRIFKEIKNANKVIFSDSFFKRKVSQLNIFLVAIKLSVTYRNISFFYD